MFIQIPQINHAGVSLPLTSRMGLCSWSEDGAIGIPSKAAAPNDTIYACTFVYAGLYFFEAEAII